MKKAVVLLSGGLDSTVALCLAKKEGYQVYALSFDYGQKHNRELECAIASAKQVGATEHKIVSLNLGSNCSLTTIHAPFLHKTKTEEIKLGAELKVDFRKTWLCYRGGENPCGTCDSCLLRAKAFAEAGVTDPALLVEGNL